MVIKMINKLIKIKLFLGCLTLLLLTNCSILNLFSPSPYRKAYGAGGEVLLKDSRAGRSDFADCMDRHVADELANNRVPGTENSHDWQTFWKKTFYFIKRESENPQWYMNCIIEKRRAAGLPELK